MKEDPSVYDYDGVYEKMQAAKDEGAKKPEPKKQVHLTIFMSYLFLLLLLSFLYKKSLYLFV